MVNKIVKKVFLLFKNAIKGVFWYCSDLLAYRKLLKNSNQKVSMKFFPQIFDRDPASHTFDKHYVYMDRWAFKHLLTNKPSEHVDVGSSIRFLSMASAVTKLKFVDIRPVNIDFDNYECIEGSILSMPFADNSVSSLSCLHVAEHIGLGRYGDPLDPLGTKKACAELSRILATGGKLYFALPIGRTATYFNAHRVHSPKIILDYFSNLKLESFSAVNDEGHFVADAKIADYENSNYSCGCFVLTK